MSRPPISKETANINYQGKLCIENSSKQFDFTFQISQESQKFLRRVQSLQVMIWIRFQPAMVGDYLENIRRTKLMMNRKLMVRFLKSFYFEDNALETISNVNIDGNFSDEERDDEETI